MKSARSIITALTLMALAAVACNEQPVYRDGVVGDGDSETSSETHWLQPCDSDAVCGDYACICNVCTIACQSDDACADADLAGTCAVEGRGPNGEICVHDTPPAGMCLPECGEGDPTSCEAVGVDATLSCLTDRCIPEPVAEDAIARRKIDILFVVDDSGSMCEEQEQLRDNFDLVVEELAAASVNFRLAVVTTDMMDPDESGRFQNIPDGETGPACSINVDISHCPTEMGEDPAPLVIDSTDPRYQDGGGDLDVAAVQRDFGCNATVGTRGNGFEMGLEATRVALSPALLETHNSGFLRDDALLGIVFVTDENDCSDGGRLDKTNGNICEWEADKLIEEQEFVDFYQSLKDSPDDLVLAGIIAPDAGIRPDFGDDVLPSCVSEIGEGFAGWRYQNVIEAFTYSNVSNICADDAFEEALAAIGEALVDGVRRVR